MNSIKYWNIRKYTEIDIFKDCNMFFTLRYHLYIIFLKSLVNNGKSVYNIIVKKVGDFMNNDFSILEKNIGYNFKDKNLLKNALTHTSYAYENKVKSYERLEYLGDSILEFISRKFW